MRWREPLQLLPWQAEWPQQAGQALAALGVLWTWTDLPPLAAHIGSTAVPGLCAKPVLDLMLGLASLNEVESRREALAALGYRYRPEYEDQLPERRYFTRDADAGMPRIHLHVLLREGELWRRQLAFRDALRSRADWRERYAALKQQLAATHAQDKSAYQDGKAPFIRDCLAELGFSHSGT